MTEHESAAPVHDLFMARVTTAIQASREGDHAGAREQFAALWAELGPAGDAFHRMTVAHFAADVEPEPRDELAWDLRALEAADLVTDERAQSYDRSLQVERFYPSLHASLAADYLKLAEYDAARRHLALAQERQHLLGDDEYGATVRNGINTVHQDLQKATTRQQ